MIQVQGLTKRYARTLAVDDVSFNIEKGQIVGFLGPNGAGKTTTMRILTCFLPPTAGTASIAGYDVVKNPMEVKRRIGYLPETPPLYPDMEVHEYLDFVGRLKGIPSNELQKRKAEAMERCSVADVRNRLISKLSKGYRQRVGLAQAIMHNPDVLILDEPTAGLDPKQINETRALIRGLAGEHTIVLSTHILPEVEQICEQVIIISKGKVRATDSVQNLTHRLRAGETVSLEIQGRSGSTISEAEVQAKLESLSGVSRVIYRDARDSKYTFHVEAMQGQFVRGDLARAVVESGWDLNELRPVALSLEEVFLQLTGVDQPAPEPEPVSGGK